MIREKFDLTGKTALVTGSTHGIGKAIEGMKLRFHVLFRRLAKVKG